MIFSAGPAVWSSKPWSWEEDRRPAPIAGAVICKNGCPPFPRAPVDEALPKTPARVQNVPAAAGGIAEPATDSGKKLDNYKEND